MSREICAEITAQVWKVLVQEGDTVADGDEIVILESMKMEIPVTSTVDGVVRSIAVKEGQAIQEGDLIAIIN